MNLRNALAKASRPFPEKLRLEVVDYAKQRRAQGTAVTVIAKELGVSHHTVRYWLDKADGVKRPKSRKRSGSLRRVAIAPEPSSSRATHERGAGELRLTLADGAYVDGLDVGDVAELVRALS